MSISITEMITDEIIEVLRELEPTMEVVELTEFASDLAEYLALLVKQQKLSCETARDIFVYVMKTVFGRDEHDYITEYLRDECKCF